MISTVRNAAIAIVSVAFGVTATATAASASSYTINDKNSDVQYYKGFDDQSPALLGHAASIKSGVDVRSFKINHGKKYVSLRFDVVHLQDEDLTADVEFQKDHQRGVRDWRAFFRVHTAVTPTGTVYSGTVTKLGDDDPTCTVDVHVISATHGSVYTRIPRTCLDNPTSLRAEAWLSRYFKPADDTAEESTRERTWSDSVSATHYRSADWTPWVASS